MAVRLLHTSWWVDFGYKGKRYRQRSPINTKAGATAFESELRHRLLVGQPLRPDAVKEEVTPTFEAFSERWLETYVRSNNRPNTWRNTRTILRCHLRPFFGRRRVDEIGPVHIEEFKKRQLSSGASRSSVNQHLTVLRTCLNAACNWGVVERVTKVKLLPQPPGRLDYLRPDEVDRLLADAAEPRMNALVRLALRTGMRQGELLALRWNDIDFDDAMLTVQRTFSGGVLSPPKNNRMRHIPLSADALEALRGLPRRSDFVFSLVPGSPLSPGTQGDGLRRLTLRANVRPFATHVLRHTFATSALRNGADVRSVQAVLGHSKLEMTARYAHVSQGSLRNAVERAALGPTRVNSASTDMDRHDSVRIVGAANSPHS